MLSSITFLRCKVGGVRTPSGALNKVLYGGALPRGPTPYPFTYHFKKGARFVYLLLINGTPFTRT